MNTQITFTVQGQMIAFTETVTSITHLTEDQAKKKMQQMVDELGMTFRGKQAKVKIVSLINK